MLEEERLKQAPEQESERQVSNWINPGGHVPLPWTGANLRGTTGLRCGGGLKATLTIGCAELILALASHPGHARDPDGRYANSPLKQWFDSLKSGKGPCCSDADGSAVSDVDWESKEGHYRVRLDGQWLDVPDEAVITEPNRTGRTMVCPIRDYLDITIRFFIQGSMT